MPFADHGGVRVHYRLEGAGRPLVLLHGFGGSSEQFYFLGWVPALRDRYRLLVMDGRGHGSSDKPHEPEAYRMDLRVGDVTAVLDHLGIDQLCCVIGGSLSARHALQCASSYLEHGCAAGPAGGAACASCTAGGGGRRTASRC